MPHLSTKNATKKNAVQSHWIDLFIRNVFFVIRAKIRHFMQKPNIENAILNTRWKWTEFCEEDNDGLKTFVRTDIKCHKQKIN